MQKIECQGISAGVRPFGFSTERTEGIHKTILGNGMTSTLPKVFKCQFCNKSYDRENWFKKHKCKKSKVFWEASEDILINSYNLFVYWQARNGFTKRGKNKTFEEFHNSWFFQIFKDLNEYLDKKKITNGQRYVDWLIEASIKEKDWKNPKNLNAFRQFLILVETPKEQAHSTRAFIKNYCEKNEIDPNDFFTSITHGQLTEMIKSYNIRPWVVFSVSIILNMIGDADFPVNLLEDIDSVYSFDVWEKKIEANPNFSREVERMILERYE